MKEETKEEQKRYKVLKRTEYENEMNGENKNITSMTIGTGLAALCAIVLISQGMVGNNTYLPVGIVDLVCSLHCLKKLIESLTKKANLKIKIDDIDKEIEMLEGIKIDISEESRGMSR